MFLLCIDPIWKCEIQTNNHPIKISIINVGQDSFICAMSDECHFLFSFHANVIH